MDHVVGQILVQVGKRIRVLGQALVLASEAVAGRDFTKLFQIDNIDGAKVKQVFARTILSQFRANFLGSASAALAINEI